MSLKCGIVGLPNVGKSTLFNALTRAGVAADNYPFCTIAPAVGTVEVPDARLVALASIVNPSRIISAFTEFVDIAGLVSGASKGEGLGNQFLANIRETNAILHVVRCFTNDNIVHVSGSIDPMRDIEVVDTELILADIATIDKAMLRYRRPADSGDKEARRMATLLEKCIAHLDQGKPVRALDLSREEAGHLKQFCLITAKPVLYAANVAEGGFENNAYLDLVRQKAKTEKAEVVVFCAAVEAEIADLDDEEKRLFLDDLGLTEPGLNRLIHAAYQLLGLHTFFTTVSKELKAWTIRQGDTAIKAAGVIHTDFARGFIRAQTIAYNDYITYGGEQGAREAGKMRAEGKDYVVRDGDVINFLFNVS